MQLETPVTSGRQVSQLCKSDFTATAAITSTRVIAVTVSMAGSEALDDLTHGWTHQMLQLPSL